MKPGTNTYTASTGKKNAAFLALALTIPLIFAACGDGKQASRESVPGNEGGTSNLSGTVRVSGSTSVQPLAQDLADMFAESYPDVVIEIQGGGSSQGIKDAANGVSDIGMSSRELNEDEKKGLTEHVIAYDGIAVAVHPSNPVSELTKEQINKIFRGEITNWKDVGGNDQEILVVSREESSGTKTAFEELLKLQEKKDDKTISLVRKDALVADGNGPVKANIASKENAIGYISLGYADSTVKKIAVDGVECTVENIKNKSYAISRPFLMLVAGEPSPEARAFLDFIKSDAGQEIVAKSYIPIN